MDFVHFFRENGIMSATESDCYFMIKFFDADEDGKLTYPEFM